MSNTYNTTNDAIIERIKNGEESAREELVTNNMRLVYNISTRFLGRGTDLDDLNQIGSLGLIKAAREFDTSYDVKFSTYAVPLIMGEIRRHLRDYSMIKASRSLKELALKVRNESAKLNAMLGHEPTIDELAQSLGVSREDIATSLEATAAPKSLNAPISDEDGSILEKFIPCEEYEDDLLSKITLNAALSHLDIKERQLIILRYIKEFTQTQTAKVLGISQVSVSRLEKKVLTKLRNSFNE